MWWRFGTMGGPMTRSAPRVSCALTSISSTGWQKGSAWTLNPVFSSKLIFRNLRITEGDDGNEFFIINTGMAICTKRGQEVARLESGARMQTLGVDLFTREVGFEKLIVELRGGLNELVARTFGRFLGQLRKQLQSIEENSGQSWAMSVTVCTDAANEAATSFSVMERRYPKNLVVGLS